MPGTAAPNQKPCYCDGRPIPPAYKEATFDKKTLKLSDLADISRNIFSDQTTTPVATIPANNPPTLGPPTPGVNLTRDQFVNLMHEVGLQSGNKSPLKKILTPKMGRIYAEEAWTEGAPKLRWTGLVKDPSLTVPVATQI